MGHPDKHHNIHHLDIVIANSGNLTPTAHQKIGSMNLTNLQSHIDTNAYSVVRLFQDVWPLLSRSSKPIFLLNSASTGTSGGMKRFAHFPLNSYAASKVLAKFVVIRLHFGYPDSVAFAVHPRSEVTESRTQTTKMLVVEVEGMSVNECVSRTTRIVRSLFSSRITSRQVWCFSTVSSIHMSYVTELSMFSIFLVSCSYLLYDIGLKSVYNRASSLLDSAEQYR